MPLPSRDAMIAALGEREFDVLIIGGGITGAGIARDAALRGLTVALVDKGDFGGGTSSRSSRLVHGGVRYLEQGDLHLVFESSAERRHLLRLAPHLVRPLAFLWPVYRGARVPRWKLAAGLTLYDLLALFRNAHPHRMLSRTAVESAEPALRRDALVGGARYFDASTNDTRLTLANVLDAAELGAVVVNHARVDSLELRDGVVRGARVTDTETRTAVQLRARVVINASGPWSDAIRAMGGGSKRPDVHGSKGVHISVSRTRVGNRDAITLLSAEDGRVMFVLPGETHTVIGTTDNFTDESPDEVRPTERDVTYLLKSVNRVFPDARLQRSDVIAAWAGIRPLIATDGQSALVTTREHAITVSPAGLISITGGKLTTYRVMAAQVVDVALRQLERGKVKCTTARRFLPGGEVNVHAAETRAVGLIGDPTIGRHLVATYGGGWEAVWNEIRQHGGAERIDPALPYTIGELRYAAAHEMARTLGDLLIRRTHVAFETRDQGRAVAGLAAASVAPILHWDADRIALEIAAYQQEVARIFTIEDDPVP